MKIPKARRLKGGQWYVYLRLGGKGYGVTAATEKDAVRKAQLFKAEWLAGNKKSSAGDLTLREAIDRYIEARPLSPSTVVGYDRIKRTHFRRCMDKPLSASVPWESVIKDELSHFAVKTEKNAVGLIKAVYKEYDLPFPNFRWPSRPLKKYRYLSADEIGRFLAEIKGDPHELGALLALHSLRASELFALTADDYDPDAETVTVRGAVVRDLTGRRVRKSNNKTETSARTIRVMIPRLKYLLDAARETPGYLVPCAENTLRRHINAACQRAGVTWAGIHGLRHTFASLAHHTGLSPLEAQEIGGWKDIRTMQKIYQHLDADDRLKAENKMAEWYRSQGKT